MKKVLSVALAMVFALSSAAMVSALSPKAFEVLAKDGVVEKKDTVTFYESWSKKDAYEELRAALLQGHRDLKADEAEFAKLQTIACDALRLGKEIENELKSVEKLKALAKEVVKLTAAKEAPIADLVADTYVKKADLKAIEDLAAKVKGFDEKYAGVSDEDFMKDLGAGDDKLILTEVFGEPEKAKTKAQYKKMLEDKLAEMVTAVLKAEYQEAYGYALDNYSEKMANKTVAQKYATLNEYMGVVKFAGEVAAKTGKKFNACAIPSDVTPAPAAEKKAEAKKDMVPNTAAAFGCAL